MGKGIIMGMEVGVGVDAQTIAGHNAPALWSQGVSEHALFNAYITTPERRNQHGT
jgi:hypothetical protein